MWLPKDWVEKLKLPRIRLLADENIKLKLVGYLREQGIDVVYAPKGTKNSSLFRLAKTDGRVLLTHDKDFADSKQYPPASSAGIVILAVHPPELSRLQAAMLKMLEEHGNRLEGRLLIVEEGSITVF